MNINPTSPLYGYSSSLPRKTSADPSSEKEAFIITPTTPTAPKSDTISLSHSGLAAASQPKETDVPPPTDGPVIDGSAIPEWLAPFYIDVETLPGGSRYLAGHEDKFSKLSSGERAEYFSSLHTHVKSLREKSGIGLDEAFTSKAASEKLHQCFIESIKGDPQLHALVSKMGISLS